MTCSTVDDLIKKFLCVGPLNVTIGNLAIAWTGQTNNLHVQDRPIYFYPLPWSTHWNFEIPV